MLNISAHGKHYLINDPGGLIGAPLKEGRPYEGPLLEHIYGKQFHGTAIDVGANVGNHTLWFAAVCGLRVVAFEPLDFGRLMANLRANQLNGKNGVVSPWPLALGDHAGKAKVIGKMQLAPATEGVTMAALDQFRLSDVALIKIDVEGMEPDVLRGGMDTIKRERPALYVEASDKEAHRRLVEILAPLRYMHTNTFGATPLEEWLPCE